jgi:Ca-activated chloride channel homolog
MFNNWNIWLNEYEFLQPQLLYGMLLLPVLAWLLLRFERKRFGDWTFGGSSKTQSKLRAHPVEILRYVLVVLKVLVLAFVLLALALPFRWNDEEARPMDNKFGIDLVIALDVSLSMLATDFDPNRLDVAKEVATNFVNSRRGDRIGLVVYAGEAYTACPPTTDYSVLTKQIELADGYDIEPGTAIGTGLGTAVVHLRSDSLQSKVIILLTDGSNNAGDITPEQAAELAKTKNICVYTIGVGTNGLAPTPIVTPIGVRYENLPVEIDEKVLKDIADRTGGKYFRATDKQALEKIYQEIDKLEKRKIADRFVQADPPPTPAAFLNWAFLCLFLVLLIELGWFIYE